MLWIITAILISYIIGSIPTAYIFGFMLKGIDIRKFGSGNVGATNALRILGKGAGITVLALDMLKGFVPVVFLGDFLMTKASLPDETIRIVLGLSCILGHIWTIFLKFKGGKGVATTFGVLLGLALKVSGLSAIFGLAILTWVLVFMLARIVSLASVLTAASLPIYMIVFKRSPALIILAIILCFIIILRHRSNLKKILQGKEPRL